MEAMTFWQWWTITGELLVLGAVCTREFREDVQSTLIPNQLKRWSPRAVFTFASIACVIAVVIWPYVLVRGFFK